MYKLGKMSEMGSSGEASEILSWKFTKDIFKEGKGNLLIEKKHKNGRNVMLCQVISSTFNVPPLTESFVWAYGYVP